MKYVDLATVIVQCITVKRVESGDLNDGSYHRVNETL